MRNFAAKISQEMRNLLFFLFVFVGLGATAQIRGNEITVTVTPDHKDWTYRTGEQVKFTVSVMRSGTLVDGAEVSYELGPEMYPAETGNLTLRDGRATVSGKLQQPGFLRLKATAHVGGKEYAGM